MEGFTILIAIVMLVFGVLQIIRFFKLWGMTNNVSRVLRLLEKQTGLTWFPYLRLDEQLGIYRTKEEIENRRRAEEAVRRRQRADHQKS